jgi:hypothetical protein
MLFSWGEPGSTRELANFSEKSVCERQSTILNEYYDTKRFFCTEEIKKCP